MGSFTPPVDLKNDLTSPEASPLANRLFRHFAPQSAGRNVLILTDGTVTEDWPSATYNADGSVDELPEDRVAACFTGGHGAYTVTDAQQTILEAAGYTVD